MNRPMGSVATCTEIMDITNGSVRYKKKALRNERRAQEVTPKVNTRKVHTGRVGSSVLETVSRTSIGESSSFSVFVAAVKLPDSISRVPIGGGPLGLSRSQRVCESCFVFLIFTLWWFQLGTYSEIQGILLSRIIS